MGLRIERGITKSKHDGRCLMCGAILPQEQWRRHKPQENRNGKHCVPIPPVEKQSLHERIVPPVWRLVLKKAGMRMNSSAINGIFKAASTSANTETTCGDEVQNGPRCAFPPPRFGIWPGRLISGFDKITRFVLSKIPFSPA
jgi:hypothetical protein